MKGTAPPFLHRFLVTSIHTPYLTAAISTPLFRSVCYSVLLRSKQRRVEVALVVIRRDQQQNQLRFERDQPPGG